MQPPRFLPITLALGSLLLLACSDRPDVTEPATLADPATEPQAPSLAQAVEHFTFRTPQEFGLVNPCNDELIHFTGERFEQGTVIRSEGTILHFEGVTVFSATGTGAATGNTYTLHGVNRFSFNSPNLEALNFTQTIPFMSHVTSQGKGEDFVSHHVVHLTVLPSGEFLTEVVHVRDVCVG